MLKARETSDNPLPVHSHEGKVSLQHNRRNFLRALIFGGFTVATTIPFSAGAKTTKKQPVYLYTKNVRSATSALNISSTRWRWIVVHHSAIKYGNATIYDRAHRERGMENGLAYHFVIGNGVDSGDGEIEIGPRWRKQLNGGHVHREDMNAVGIGICMVGNFEATKPTTKQVAALSELINYLKGATWGRKLKFTIHKEVEPGRTVCPGKNFPLVKMQMMYGKNKVPKIA